MAPLVLDGLKKVKAGIVSVEEVLQSAYSVDGQEGG